METKRRTRTHRAGNENENKQVVGRLDNCRNASTRRVFARRKFGAGWQNSARTLQKAYITGGETEDLLVTDSNNNRVEILFKEPKTDKNRAAFTSETKFQEVDFGASPAAVLPMRLNVMGQQGFVFFGKGSLEPTTVMAAPNATFTVTTTTDENNGACSAAGTGCSVREAINAANGAAGADMITFASNGTSSTDDYLAGTKMRGSEGDLDVTQALTISRKRHGKYDYSGRSKCRNGN